MQEDIKRVKEYLQNKYNYRLYLTEKEAQKETLLSKASLHFSIPRSGQFYHILDIAEWIVKEWQRGNKCA